MLTLWRPDADLFHWSREFDNWLCGAQAREALAPAVDVEEQEQRYVIRADLPGMDEKDIDVQVVDGVLVLSAKHDATHETKRENLTYTERRRGTFCRQFTLGKNVDQSKIEATYKNGVLTVALPKKPAAVPRQIPVQPS